MTTHMRRHHHLSSNKKPENSKPVKSETVKPTTSLTQLFGFEHASASERAKLITFEIASLIQFTFISNSIYYVTCLDSFTIYLDTQ